MTNALRSEQFYFECDNQRESAMSELRDALRAKLLATRKPGSRLVPFFGEMIELRQPKLSDILQVKDSENEQVAVISTLIQYAYVPETEERVFEEGDIDALLAMPFGADFVGISTALQELTSVNFLEPKPSSDGTDSGSQ